MSSWNHPRSNLHPKETTVPKFLVKEAGRSYREHSGMGNPSPGLSMSLGTHLQVGRGWQQVKPALAG